jgi:hypothetical protein
LAFEVGVDRMNCPEAGLSGAGSYDGELSCLSFTAERGAFVGALDRLKLKRSE